MFDRFTDRARKVMGYSRQEAQRLSHDYIGTEHILLGLVDVRSSAAADVLKKLDVDPARIRGEVEKRVTRGSAMVTMGFLPFTPRTKRVLELALEEASNLGHNHIGTEHLLLGLIREQEGIAAQVLESLNVRLVNVREAALEVLARAEDMPPSPGRTPVAARTEPRTPPRETEDDPGPLTPRARGAMELASVLARHTQHEHIGTEHMLLGIIDEGASGSELPRLLLARLRAETEKLMTPGTARVTRAPVSLTPAAKAALEHAFLAARDLKSDRVGIGHLIAGLIRERDGIAARVLSAAGLSPEDALREEPKRTGKGASAPLDAIGPLDAAQEVVRRLKDALPGSPLKAMAVARQEALRFRHDCIGTEHVLLGLVAAGAGAKGLLRKLSVDPEQVRTGTERRMTPGNAKVSAGQLPLTPSLKRALQLALEEARGEIREEHLLLGLVREGEGAAAQVLAELGVTADALRAKLVDGPPTPPE